MSQYDQKNKDCFDENPYKGSAVKPSVQSKLKPFIQPNIQPVLLKNKSNKEDGKIFNALSEEKSQADLPEDVQTKMESSFGTDFSDVKIHKDSTNADELGAKAYTQGKDVHFAPGEFQPNTKSGQELIGHELTHVVQQKQGKVNGADLNGKGLVNDDPALEKEADVMGQFAAAGANVNLADGNKKVAPTKFSPIQKVVAEVLNYGKIAEEINTAISGIGTDEDAIYAALTRLNKREAAINELKRIYQIKYKTSLVSDLQGDLEGEELQYAISLLTPKAAAKAPVAVLNYNDLAKSIHTAISGIGTDETAVYSALGKLGRDSTKIAQLKASYKALYKVELKADLADDFSGDQLKLVLELIGETSLLKNEKVNVANNKEYIESQKIIRRIWENYRIDVNSQAGVDAIRKDYSSVPLAVTNGLKTKTWEYKELVALEKALSHFGPILGVNRETSTRKDENQEVRTVSKVDQAIDTDSPSGVLDNTTLGEYFGASKNFSMFTAGTNSTIDFPHDNAKQLEGTAIHEIAHGLCKYALPDFIATFKYWRDQYVKSGKAGMEAPPTNYGSKSAAEDLSESVMFYFVDPNRLKNGNGAAAGIPGNACPLRFAYIQKLVKNWK